MAIDIVGFRISSELAMFRRWYTTTTSISYPFPPPTAVAGMIGAILGIPREQLWAAFEGRISIIIDNPIRIIQQGVNYVDTKREAKHKNFNIRVLHHYLYQPAYLIFYQGPWASDISTKLSQQESVYPIYLGHAYNLAEIHPIQITKTETIMKDKIDSIVANYITDIDWNKNNQVHIETMDVRMREDYTPVKTQSLAYSFNTKNGKPLPIFLKNLNKLTKITISMSNGERELFLDWVEV